MSLDDFIQAMPKAELHVHLEGSTRPETLLELARRNGVSLPAQDVPGLQALYQFKDFSHFIDVYMLILSCLRTPEDWTMIVRSLGAEMDRQNIRYAEVTWTPSTSVRPDLPFSALLAAVEEGCRQAQRTWGVMMRWLPDAARDLGPEAALQAARYCVEGQGHGILGLGLGGSENLYPPELFVSAFALAKQAGLKSYPHAGELAGPTSIWNALRLLHADRIGHGVRAIEDPELVAYLRERQITIDICPTSNIALHVYPDYAAHPLRQLYEAGVPVTLNSDDPPLFNTTLVQEYRLAAHVFGFGADELCSLGLQAVRASFLPEEEKARLEREFSEEYERLKRRYL